MIRIGSSTFLSTFELDQNNGLEAMGQKRESCGFGGDHLREKNGMLDFLHLQTSKK